MATQVTLNSGSVDSAGSLALKTNGTTTAVTIDTSQNVSAVGSLGTTISSKTAEFNAAGGSIYASYGDGTKTWRTGVGIFAAGQFSIRNATDSLQAIDITSAGNVGIGTSSPADSSARLTVSGTSTVLLDASGSLLRFNKTAGTDTGWLSNRSYSWHDGNGLALSTSTADALKFGTNGSERARIDSSGNLLVGKTVTSIGTAGTWIEGTGSLVSSLAASTSSSSTLHAYSTTASAYRFYVGMDGRVNATLTTISAISDERLKENIKDLDFGLSEVLSLKPRRFDWKEGKGADTKDAVGFIAQEFETVFPNSVGTAKAGEDGIEYKNICHDELIPTLVKAIQEQQAIITQLQADVAALKGASA